MYHDASPAILGKWHTLSPRKHLKSGARQNIDRHLTSQHRRVQSHCDALFVPAEGKRLARCRVCEGKGRWLRELVEGEVGSPYPRSRV
jgi:hypothetical protein